MPNEKKGITVRIDAELHAQVREYIEAHGMTMADFVAQALDNELHPRIQEVNSMGNMRTMAFQIPTEMFDEIKDYLNRHHMKQKDFVLGLIKTELERDRITRQAIERVRDQAEEQHDGENESDDEDLEEDEDIEETEDMAMNME